MSVHACDMQPDRSGRVQRDWLTHRMPWSRASRSRRRRIRQPRSSPRIQSPPQSQQLARLDRTCAAAGQCVKQRGVLPRLLEPIADWVLGRADQTASRQNSAARIDRTALVGCRSLPVHLTESISQLVRQFLTLEDRQRTIKAQGKMRKTDWHL